MVKDAIWSLKYNWNKDDWEFDEFYMDVIMKLKTREMKKFK